MDSTADLVELEQRRPGPQVTRSGGGAGGWHERRWLALGALCLSMLLIGLDNTVLNVALSSLSRELDARSTDVQWILDSYILVFASLMMLAGSLGDRFGRRRVLLIGLAVFACASLAGTFAGSAAELIAARAVMGVGAALIFPSTLSLLTTTFLDPRERARAFGVWSAFTGVSMAVGPTLGGWMLDRFWWGAILLINVPITVLALAVVPLVVAESRDRAARIPSVPNMALATVGLFFAVGGLIEAPAWGWAHPLVLGAFAVSAAAFGVFAACERRVSTPVIETSLLRNPRFSVAAACISIAYFCLFGSLLSVTTYLQGVLGYSPLEAGVRLLPLAGGMIVGAVLATRLGATEGLKVPAVVGLLFIVVGQVILAMTTHPGSYADLVVAMVLSGVGMAMAVQTTTEAVMGAVSLDRAGTGSALNDTSRQVGGALGIAVLGSIVHSAYSDRMSGYRHSGALDAAHDNMAAAVQVAGRLGGADGARLLETAKSAFVHAMSVSSWVAAGCATVAALLVAFGLPHWAGPNRDGSAVFASGPADVDGSSGGVTDAPSLLDAVHPLLQDLVGRFEKIDADLQASRISAAEAWERLNDVAVEDAGGGRWSVDPQTARFQVVQPSGELTVDADPALFEPAGVWS